ncbi:MAG: hypothetical protein ACTSYA_12105 [Candidatus Kariarchaeaceae archaeon]
MSEKQEQEYKDFIEIKPEVVMKVNSEQMKLLIEYNLITKNLGERKQMTVKEIHELYWDEKKKKHGKTLKTIYRYMDLLEEQNIVQVAGHRKPKGSHLTEKLYSKKAIIYLEEEAKPSKWWREKEGMKQLEMIWKVSKKFFGWEEEKMKDYANVIGKYFQEREEIIRELLLMIEGDKELAEELRGISIMEFKNIFSMISMIKSFSRKGTVRSKLDELF